MYIQVLPLCIPWIGCVEPRWQAFLAIISALVVVRYMKLNSSREYLESLRKSAIGEAERRLPCLKQKATDRDPELDHDSEWASAYSVAINRWVRFVFPPGFSALISKPACL